MKKLLLVVVALWLPVASAAWAQAPVEELPRARISDPNRALFRLGVPSAVGDAAMAREATDLLRKDMAVSGLFNVLDPKSFPADLESEGMKFSSALWTQVGAQGVAKMRLARAAGGVSLDGALYQVGRGDTAVLTKRRTGSDVRTVVHQWANDILQQLTGMRGVFGSRIAFAQAGRAGEISTIGMAGDGAATVTSMRSECMLPAFSPTGREIAFTSFLRGGADLWVVAAGGGRARRISARPGLNTGAAWLPDGSSLVATLSYEGNAELYRLSASDGKVLARLTRTASIDTSASVSADGRQIAFVSDRQGGPQIFVMPVSGGAAKRVTFKGGYNQTPRWNPKAETPYLAFTGRDERGVFDVFYLDMKSGNVERITQAQGSNYDPAWSPDGRLLVYASSRGGLFVMNVQTRREYQIYRGGAKAPSWGPAPADR